MVTVLAESWGYTCPYDRTGGTLGEGVILEVSDVLVVVVGVLFLAAAFHVGHMMGRQRGWMEGMRDGMSTREPAADEPDY